MSCVILSFTCVDEILPPHKPGWYETPPSLIKGMPSLYQLSSSTAWDKRREKENKQTHFIVQRCENEKGSFCGDERVGVKGDVEKVEVKGRF